jgi:hypothetical protein
LDRRIRPAMTSSCDFETNSHRFSRRPPARIAESEATLGRLCKTTARQSVAAGSPCCKILHGHWSLLGVPPQAFSCSCQLCVVKLPYDRATYTPAHYPKASACEASDLGGEAIISLHGIPALLSSTSPAERRLAQMTIVIDPTHHSVVVCTDQRSYLTRSRTLSAFPRSRSTCSSARRRNRTQGSHALRRGPRRIRRPFVGRSAKAAGHQRGGGPGAF